MDLKTYLTDKKQRELASALGVTQGAVSQWVTGRVEITAERAIQIENATGGAVSRNDLRPDIFGHTDRRHAPDRRAVPCAGRRASDKGQAA